MRTVKITSYNSLLAFLEDNELSSAEVVKVASEALKVVVFEEGKDSLELVQDVKQYVKKLKKTGQRAIFLNLPSLDAI